MSNKDQKIKELERIIKERLQRIRIEQRKAAELIERNK